MLLKMKEERERERVYGILLFLIFLFSAFFYDARVKYSLFRFFFVCIHCIVTLFVIDRPAGVYDKWNKV